MESRVAKYKEYRASMIKEGYDEVEISNKLETTTLPLNEVMKAQKEQVKSNEFKSLNMKKVVVTCLVVLVALAIITGIIVLGVFAFRR